MNAPPKTARRPPAAESTRRPHPSPARAWRALFALVLPALAALAAGCGTTHPPPLARAALVEAQTFPYFRIYWVGPRFNGLPLAAVDGSKSYSTTVGDSVYYGDCVTGKGLLGGGGSCRLPLQVTTVIYRRHENKPLGPQRNILIRGVPAVVYDEGRSIELYSERMAIDVFSDTPADALLAAEQLRTLNAPGSATAGLPPPVFCPVLYGRACQKDAASVAAAERLAEKPLPGR
jgi:hypothetical protein